MSRISIRIKQPTDIPQIIRVIRPLTDKSMAVIRSAIDCGSPIMEHELFLNDFPMVAESLRQVVCGLKAIGARFTIYEREDEITEDVLLNILQAAENYR